MLYQITAPANNERGPRYMEKALAAIHQAHSSRSVSLLYGVREGRIGLLVRCDEADRDAVIEPMVAGYPEASMASMSGGPPVMAACSTNAAQAAAWNGSSKMTAMWLPTEGGGREAEFDRAMLDLPPMTPAPPLSKVQQRLLVANERIVSEPPDRSDFLHTVMCQVGMPRRATEATTFERTSGPFSVLLEAGKLWNGREWQPHPLPYGTTPRLVMVHLSSEAIRTQNRRVELGDSVRQFLQALGLPTTGGARGGYSKRTA